MLVFSNQRIRDLELSCFHANCRAILIDNYPEYMTPDFDLPGFVVRKDAEALREGLLSELCRFRYIHAALALGVKFPDDIPVMRAILNRGDLPPSDRSFLVEKTLQSMMASYSKPTLS